MIEVATEQLVHVREVPWFLPRQLNGRRVHISAVYRWMSRGVRGVLLEFVQVGGRRYTSKEVLQRFADRLTSSEAPAVQESTPRRRQREIERAAKRLEEILGRSHRDT